MKVLMLAMGTLGDHFPHIALGRALRRRGHRVCLLANEHFERYIAREDVEYVPVGTNKEWHEVFDDPIFWHPVKGVFHVVNWSLSVLRPQFRAVAEHYEPGNTVLVSQHGVLSSLCAQDKLGIPVATFVFVPSNLRSLHEFPRLACYPRIPDWMPRWVKWSMSLAIDVAGHRALAGELNRFRAELGLAPVKNVPANGLISRDLVLGMFPPWFAAPQPDWPEQLRLVGFPLADRVVDDDLPADAEEHLRDGEPPVVFTYGTSMMHGRAYFEAATEACLRLGRRGILLSQHEGQVPDRLPASVRRFRYLPLARLLPRSAALVHHGGIGTSARAMASGIPQLIVPMAYDQPDNGMRVKELGVGDWLRPRAFRPDVVADRLRRLIESPEVARRCREVRQRIETQAIDPLELACDHIEELMARHADGSGPVVRGPEVHLGH